MVRTKFNNAPLSTQFKAHSKKVVEADIENEGNFDQVVSTGSTLLDLAISGGVVRGGGIPGGIFVEIFGPPGAGKTVIISEIAYRIQKRGGEVKFCDPEGRLNPKFASLFGVDVTKIDYSRPDEISELFQAIYKWDPQPKGVMHALLADSLAALCSDVEMSGDDAYGARRAKQFSEGFRKTCRILANNNYIMIASNQIRDEFNAQGHGPKTKSSGGRAIPHYASLRLRCMTPAKITKKKKIAGSEQSRVIGTETSITVVKSSVWESWHEAPLTVIYDYGIDDIRQNLQFIKDNTGGKIYTFDNEKLAVSLDASIAIIEEEKLEKKLREETIDLWLEIEEQFKTERKRKR